MLLDSEDEEEENTIYNGATTESSVEARRKLLQQQRSQEKRGHSKATVHSTSATQAENMGYVWERNGDNVGLSFARSAMAEKVAGVNTAGTRCSVSEDVLAAWGSLGGWRDVSI